MEPKNSSFDRKITIKVLDNKTYEIYASWYDGPVCTTKKICKEEKLGTDNNNPNKTVRFYCVDVSEVFGVEIETDKDMNMHYIKFISKLRHPEDYKNILIRNTFENPPTFVGDVVVFAKNFEEIKKGTFRVVVRKNEIDKIKYLSFEFWDGKQWLGGTDTRCIKLDE